MSTGVRGRTDAPRVLDQPGHLLRGDARGGDDQVALILAVLVVDDDEELAARDAEVKAKEGEKREKLIEESKKIVLTEDASLPKATKVCDLPILSSRVRL